MSSAEKEKFKPEVIEVAFREVLIHTGDSIAHFFNDILSSNVCEKFRGVLEPFLIRMEQFTGRGGNMTQGYS